ncbi:RNA polymerase sigma factor [Devosia sp. SL43]|uniref:RNA polymerase sigma factor n=1 Tax=Devosia sp. SL43 TaxID=2806348 RepID=UPI001F418C44|nr:RNA polymerase sigma factor [Devosia sp. SL43]UJW86505.1 RNA polymerase sigma factor [Devosia sp. SL43]
MGLAGPTELDAVWRQHSRKVLATLIRLLRDFDLAEEALHDAFLVAANKWPREGMPDNPSAWLISAGRFRALDKLRQRACFDTAQAELALLLADTESAEETHLADDQLRLIFTCCHPDLAPEAQVALTLREVCGLTTEEIARAFLIRTPTLAQRIVRAKLRIKEAGLPYEIPAQEELPGRLDSVLRVIYLVFNEGYSAHSGDSIVRAELSVEAVRLGRLLAGLLPDGEVLGLLGLMLLNEARRQARQTSTGDVVLLADQDRSLWDRAMMAEGTILIEQAFRQHQVGPYVLQGAIAAVHAAASSAAETDWNEILGLYGILRRAAPSPIVQLNRAIAVSMVRGPAAALPLVQSMLDTGQLADYHLAHVAEADLLRQLGRNELAKAAYVRALQLCRLEPERRLLQRRLAELAPS